SVQHPVLPTDFAFAVIQSDGRVVFHSCAARRLYENFFEESSAAAAIRSAIEAGDETGGTGSYRGRTMRFHVSPIPHSPWTLIVMRDPEATRSELVDAVMTWAVSFAVYLALFLLLLLSGRRWRTLRWFWPSRHRVSTYRNACFVLAVAIMAGAGILAAGRLLHGLALLGSVLVVILAGLWYVGAPFERAPRDAVARALASRFGRAGQSPAAWAAVSVAGALVARP